MYVCTSLLDDENTREKKATYKKIKSDIEHTACVSLFVDGIGIKYVLYVCDSEILIEKDD